MNKRLWLTLWGICIIMCLMIVIKGKRQTPLVPVQIQTLLVLHAQALSPVVDELSDAFMFEHPDMAVRREAASNQACVEKLLDPNQPCDLIVSTDPKLIETLLIPEYIDRNIRFARYADSDISRKPVICSVALANRAPQPDAAKLWLQYLLSEKAHAILEKNGLLPIVSPTVISDLERQ